MKNIEIIIVKFRTISRYNRFRENSKGLTSYRYINQPYSIFFVLHFIRFVVNDLPTISDYLNLSYYVYKGVIIP